ncbi:MAG: carbohydrate-binding domain-containing protein [Prevotella sp.]|nr:carbohydrate-binding domain-containing protein [Prevotella sp.]
MKKTLPLTLILALCAIIPSSAQTMRVRTGNITYAHAASQTGHMPFTSSQTLTIQGKAYTIGDISDITVDATTVADGTISAHYDGDAAQVVVAGNIAQYVDVRVEGAHVTVLQSAELADPITYTLSGSSQAGSFYMDGDLKGALILDNLSLTNPDSSAVKIECGKLLDITLIGNSTLADAVDGTHKGCLYLNGHSVWTGSGTLTLTGNTNHALFADEYMRLADTFTGTITVADAKSDGFHVNQFYEQLSGTVNITSQGDGIDVGITGKQRTADGQFLFDGGTLTVTTSGIAAKAIKCDSLMTITGGTLSATTTGNGMYDETEKDIKVSTALKAGTTLTISGGTIAATSTGSGARGISADTDVTFSGGNVTVVTTGSPYVYSSSDNKANGVKAGNNITIADGRVFVAASADSGTAFKATKRLLVNGGTLMAIGAKESVPALASTQTYERHLGIEVKAGEALTVGGVTFTIPAIYSNNGAYILVSSPEM